VDITDRYDVSFKEFKNYLTKTALLMRNCDDNDEEKLDNIIKEFLCAVSTYNLNKHNYDSPFADTPEEGLTDDQNVQFFMPNLNKNIVLSELIWELMPDWLDIFCNVVSLSGEQIALITIYKFINFAITVLKSNKNPVGCEYCIFSLIFRNGFGSNVPGQSKSFNADKIIEWLPSECGSDCRVTTKHCNCRYRIIENYKPICNFPDEDRNITINEILDVMTVKGILTKSENTYIVRW
jgi:hypothetical protein